MIGCDKKHNQPFTTYVIVRYGNPKDGGIEMLLPSSAGYQRSKDRIGCIRFIWKDDQGNEYSFVIFLVKGHGDISKFVEIGRKQRGWRLVGKNSFQTISGHCGKILIFQKENRITEWICFPFENYPGGVVIYWSSTMQRYHINRKVLYSLFKQFKLLHPGFIEDKKFQGQILIGNVSEIPFIGKGG